MKIAFFMILPILITILSVYMQVLCHHFRGGGGGDDFDDAGGGGSTMVKT